MGSDQISGGGCALLHAVWTRGWVLTCTFMLHILTGLSVSAWTPAVGGWWIVLLFLRGSPQSCRGQWGWSLVPLSWLSLITHGASGTGWVSPQWKLLENEFVVYLQWIWVHYFNLDYTAGGQLFPQTSSIHWYQICFFWLFDVMNVCAVQEVSGWLKMAASTEVTQAASLFFLMLQSSSRGSLGALQSRGHAGWIQGSSCGLLSF